MARGYEGWDMGSIFEGYVQEHLNSKEVLQAVQ